MLRLAADAMISFSDKPLKWPLYMGIALIIGSLVYVMLALPFQLALGESSLFAWIVATCALLNGLVLISIGLTGQYISRIFDEVRGRPLYIANEYKGSFQNEERTNKE